MRGTVRELIQSVGESAEDFEFYPTTNEILEAMAQDLKQHLQALERRRSYRHPRDDLTVMDVGAGNGKPLLFLREQGLCSTMLGIEKSGILRDAWPRDILLAGTDLWEQTLISTHVDIVFSNPPYRQFERWCSKVIREAAAWRIYLVIPYRWENSQEIKQALEFRSATWTKLGEFKFAFAEDRPARAVVHLVRIDLAWERPETDPHKPPTATALFRQHFEEQFREFLEGRDAAYLESKRAIETPDPVLAALTVNEDFVSLTVAAYQAQMTKLHRSYQAALQMDPYILQTLGVSVRQIVDSLYYRLQTTRHSYWQQVFDKVEKLKQRLTSKARQRLFDRLQKHSQMDFTLSNVNGLILWLLKNTNRSFDDQLVEVFELLVDKCNVVMYKSNKRAFQENWRYNKDDASPSHYALDYRIVSHRVGGLPDPKWYSGDALTRLTDDGYMFLEDLATVARNLGFVMETMDECRQRKWQAGKVQEFWAKDSGTGERVLLLRVRAFKNRNIHLQFYRPFILAWNVEVGRLKGWLKSGEEAAEELKDPKAAELFKCSLQLPTNQGLLALQDAP